MRNCPRGDTGLKEARFERESCGFKEQLEVLLTSGSPRSDSDETCHPVSSLYEILSSLGRDSIDKTTSQGRCENLVRQCI